MNIYKISLPVRPENKIIIISIDCASFFNSGQTKVSLSEEFRIADNTVGGIIRDTCDAILKNSRVTTCRWVLDNTNNYQKMFIL